MHLRVFCLFLMLALAVDGEEFEVPFLHFTDIKPLSEIPCPKKCSDLMTFGFDMGAKIFGSILTTFEMTVDFCQQCIVGGMQNYKVDYKCFMSPDEQVYDHHINVSIPNFSINCTCDFSNKPSEVADKINAGNVAVGECGKEKVQNKLQCKTMNCEGSGDGQSTVKLLGNLAKSVISLVLRVDTREKKDVFPIVSSLILNDNAKPVTHDAPTEFDAAGKCLDENKESVICHLFSNFQTPLYNCLGRPNLNSHTLFHSILYEYGRCPK